MLIPAWLKGREEAARFGQRAYPNCRVHAESAEAVRVAVERLTKARHPELPLDETVAQVLGYPGSGPFAGIDSLAAAERLIAMGEEFEDPETGMDHAVAQEVLATLLGPAEKATTWDAATVWTRSIRAIINARAGKAGCTCLVEQLPTAWRDGA